VLDILSYVLGTYAAVVPPELLLQSKYTSTADQASPTTARLCGVRAAFCSETKTGQRLDLATVKKHTGESKMVGRYLHANPFEFEITHRLLLATNALPDIEHTDEAIRGRVHVTPFDRTWNRSGHPDPDPTLPNGDPTLLARLKDEAQGILAWMVAGAVAYHREGLPPAPEVATMTTGYLRSQDSIGLWLAECCERCTASRDEGLTSAEALEAFNRWAEQNDRQVMDSKTFGQAMKRNRVDLAKCTRGGKTVRVYGLNVKAEIVTEQIMQEIGMDPFN
jgi:putative DNA primase/helicase